MTAAATINVQRPGSLEDSVARVGVGVQAGLVGGMVMLAVTCLYAGLMGMGIWAPFRMMATVVGTPMDPSFHIIAVAIGLMVHLTFSMTFGVMFSLLMSMMLYERDWVVQLTGAGFGLAIYVINFHLLGAMPLLEAFAPMRGNAVEMLVHVLFGVVVANGFLRWRDDVVQSSLGLA